MKALSSSVELYVAPSGLPANQVKGVPSNVESQRVTPTPSPAISNATSSFAMKTHVPSSVPHVADPPAEADPGQKERQPVTKSTERQTLELSTSQRVWNAAYDSLEREKDTAELAKSYVKTLTKVLRAERASDVSVSEDDVLFELKDPMKWQEYIKKLVVEGQKKISTSLKIIEAVGDVAQFILSAKGMIDVAIQNTSQAALPWVGVCMGLQVSNHHSHLLALTNVYPDLLKSSKSEEG